MQNFTNEVKQYSEIIWSSLFGLEIAPARGPLDAGKGPVAQGIVPISGSWTGQVILKMEAPLVDTLTEKMFALAPGKATDTERNDAVAEMTNMIGGNIKALLPQPCELSIPMVVLDGKNPEIPNTETCTEVTFECEGSRFMVSILAPKNKSSHKGKTDSVPA